MRHRLSVFRSAKHIYGQIIDSEKGKTIVSVSETNLSNSDKVGSSGATASLTNLTKTQKAREVGLALAKKALEKKIDKIVFDRGSFRYHGRVKALAEGAREGGLKF